MKKTFEKDQNAWAVFNDQGTVQSDSDNIGLYYKTTIVMDIKAQIQKYLVESGNYEKVSNLLNEKLLQEGWVDHIRNLTVSEMKNNENSNYSDILKIIEPKAIGMCGKNVV